VLQFAQDHAMFVQFSDWHWQRFAPWDPILAEQQAQLAAALDDYPNLVTLTYANNEPNGESAQRLDTWPEALTPFNETRSQYGLSDQTWLCNNTENCPAVVAWAASAANQSQFIQFEPAWAHFSLPVGTFTDSSFNASTGHPTALFAAVARMLSPSPGADMLLSGVHYPLPQTAGRGFSLGAPVHVSSLLLRDLFSGQARLQTVNESQLLTLNLPSAKANWGHKLPVIPNPNGPGYLGFTRVFLGNIVGNWAGFTIALLHSQDGVNFTEAGRIFEPSFGESYYDVCSYSFGHYPIPCANFL